jgi:hypothetical protein
MMAQPRNDDASVEQLVERFLALAVAQRDAVDKYQTTLYNRLYDRMKEVELELKSRGDDQRRALLPLLASRDVHVRLKAALAVLAIAPEPARKALRSVRDYGLLPQSMDATEMLNALDSGVYIPS